MCMYVFANNFAKNPNVSVDKIYKYYRYTVLQFEQAFKEQIHMYIYGYIYVSMYIWYIFMYLCI